MLCPCWIWGEAPPLCGFDSDGPPLHVGIMALLGSASYDGNACHPWLASPSRNHGAALQRVLRWLIGFSALTVSLDATSLATDKSLQNLDQKRLVPSCRQPDCRAEGSCCICLLQDTALRVPVLTPYHLRSALPVPPTSCWARPSVGLTHSLSVAVWKIQGKHCALWQLSCMAAGRVKLVGPLYFFSLPFSHFSLHPLNPQP